MNEKVMLAILNKLLSDGELEKQINNERCNIGLELLSREYIMSILSLLAGKRENLYNYDYKNAVLGIYGGIIYRKMELENIGDIIDSHKHNYDHFTYVEKGVVDINGQIYKAGQWAKVPKDVLHTIKALKPNCIAYCINSEHEVMAGDS